MKRSFHTFFLTFYYLGSAFSSQFSLHFLFHVRKRTFTIVRKKVLKFPYIFPHILLPRLRYIWHVRKTDIYNCKEKSVDICLHYSSHFTTPHFPHNFPYIYFSSHFPYIFAHIWHVRKTDIYNSNVRKMSGKCEEIVRKFAHFSSHSPHIEISQ